MASDHNIQLKTTQAEDLDQLYSFQLDKEARYLAAFTSAETLNEASYVAKMSKFLKDPSINSQTIYLANKIVGSVAKFEMHGNAEITYWLDKNYWGRGIITAALKHFLQIEKNRPIFGRVAFDNFGSQRILIKCGFIKVEIDKGYAFERQKQIEEFVYKLL